jgi:hypothetical protein
MGDIQTQAQSCQYQTITKTVTCLPLTLQQAQSCQYQTITKTVTCLPLILQQAQSCQYQTIMFVAVLGVDRLLFK